MKFDELKEYIKIYLKKLYLFFWEIIRWTNFCYSFDPINI